MELKEYNPKLLKSLFEEKNEIDPLTKTMIELLLTNIILKYKLGKVLQ